jgi:hypothetical protein
MILKIPAMTTILLEVRTIVFYVMGIGNVLFDVSNNNNIEMEYQRYRAYLDISDPFHANFYEIAKSMPDLFFIRERKHLPIVYVKNMTIDVAQHILDSMASMGSTYMSIEMQETPNLNNNNMEICDLHLTDLYEMGYMTNHSLPTKFGICDVFTGIDVFAARPVTDDVVEFSCSYHEFYFFVMFHLQDPLLSRDVEAILDELPFNHPSDREDFKTEWRTHNVLEISGMHFLNMDFTSTTTNHYWFLKKLNRLLDRFDDYKLALNPRAFIIPEFDASSPATPLQSSSDVSSDAC